MCIRDRWGEGNLKEILAILEREKIKATFFMSGSWIANFPELAQEILLKGHEIGKYSFSSIPFTYLTEEDIGIEFANFNKLTAEVLELSLIHISGRSWLVKSERHLISMKNWKERNNYRWYGSHSLINIMSSILIMRKRSAMFLKLH